MKKLLLSMVMFLLMLVPNVSEAKWLTVSNNEQAVVQLDDTRVSIRDSKYVIFWTSTYLKSSNSSVVAQIQFDIDTLYYRGIYYVFRYANGETSSSDVPDKKWLPLVPNSVMEDAVYKAVLILRDSKGENT